MQVYVNTHMQDLKADTHSHNNNSITQTSSEPKQTSLGEVCKQISRQCDVFPLPLSRFYNRKEKKNHLCVHAVFLLWRGAGSFKADDMQRLRWVLTAHGCDSTGRHHGNPVYHPQLPHLLSLVLSPNAANNPGSLRHLRDQSSSLSG